MNASNQFFTSEDVLETYRPNKLGSLFNLVVLVALFIFCTSVMFSEGGIVAGLICHLIMTLPWAFFGCRDLFFRDKMWMKITTKGIAISRVFGKLLFIPWDKIKGFEDRTIRLMDPQVHVTFVEGFKTIDDDEDSLQLSYFYGAEKTVEKLNRYLSQYK